MAKSAVDVLIQRHSRSLEWAKQGAIIVSASLFVGLCAHVAYLLPGNPVPLTLQNFGVLLVGLVLGSGRGFAALALYLAEGAAGLPVFNPYGPGGIPQLVGPTGGYLMMYPLVAASVGLIFEHGKRSFSRAACAALSGEILLFAAGIGWLAFFTHSLRRAVFLGLYWFVFAEIMKVMFAAAITIRVRRGTKA